MSRRVTKEKPVVILKSGITEAGSKAALSHTGSLAGKDEVFNAVCRQAGIIRVKSLDELIDLIKAFAFQPLLKGDSVAVISFTGAGCVIAADACVENGLTLAKISCRTEEKIRRVTPDWYRISNPVDLWPAVEAFGATEAYNTTINTLIEDKSVDGIMIFLAALKGITSPHDLYDLDVLKEERRLNKPLLFSIIGDKHYVELMTEVLEKSRFPAYLDIMRTVKALAVMYCYNARKKRL